MTRPSRRCCGQALAAMLLALLAACGDGPPTGPTPQPLAIACPPPVSATSPTGGPTVVSYPAPVVTGGRVPVATQCAPASGALFPLGATTVTCTATDADRQTRSCSFVVTVSAPPYLRFVKFLAFGDSLTEGQDGLAAAAGAGGYVPLVVRPEIAYPTKLQQALTARYTAQSPAVTNAGKGGETAGAGAVRLPGVLASVRPEVLLLLEGANDISGGDPLGISRAVGGLRTMVREGRRQGLTVLLATLPPQREGGSRAGGAALVVPLNTEIKLLAAQEGSTLVDLYTGFAGDLTLIGPDGLHPNESGYARMADLFLATIRATLEAPFPGAAAAPGRWYP